MALSGAATSTNSTVYKVDIDTLRRLLRPIVATVTTVHGSAERIHTTSDWDDVLSLYDPFFSVVPHHARSTCAVY
jgi:hypothetical protein